MVREVKRTFFLLISLVALCACAHEVVDAPSRALLDLNRRISHASDTDERVRLLMQMYDTVAAMEAGGHGDNIPQSVVDGLSTWLSDSDGGTVQEACVTLGLMGTRAATAEPAIRSALAEAERQDLSTDPILPEVPAAPTLRRCLASVTGQSSPLRP